MLEIIRAYFKKQDFFTKRNITIGALFIVGLSLFITIYDGVLEHDGLASLDAPLRTWASTVQSPELTTFMYYVSEISAPLSVALATIAGFIFWSMRYKEYWRPMLLAGAVGLALLTSAIIKTLTARERPTITDLINAHGSVSYSFPSGHTIGAATLLFVLAYFYCVKKPTWKRITIVGVLTMSAVALVALSRIYLGYHWLTDVTASVGLAFVILSIVIAVDTYIKPRKKVTSSEEA